MEKRECLQQVVGTETTGHPHAKKKKPNLDTAFTPFTKINWGHRL